MLGYIRPCKPELRIREYEIYKSVYCGQCRQLGKVFGPFARLTLSYDFAFLSLLQMGLNDTQADIKQSRCEVNPFLKKSICQSCDEIDYTCTVAMLMIYHKLQDNFQDNGIKDKLLSAAAYPFILPAYEKAGKRFPEIELIIASMMCKQKELEQAKCSSVDQACEPTAKAMEEIAAGLSSDAVQQRILRRFGYLLGRWVYQIDALDDLTDDVKKGNYNPFAVKYELTDADEHKIAQVKEQAKASLYMTIGEIGTAYELLDIKRYKPILDNIIHLGLKDSVDRLYSSCSKKI